MDLTSKQRAQLRGLANSIDTIVHIGKDGLGENLVKQADDALEARELIKCRVLENMRGQLDRTCRFVSVITLCMPNGDVITARGECRGTLAYAPQGENGFGYDPLFYLPQYGCTAAQLTPAEKNAVSHRAIALRGILAQLEK